MKKVKYITIIILMIGVAINSYAQTGRTPADQAKQLQVQLKLTDVQTTKLATVLQQIDNEHANDKTAQANFKNWQATRNTKAMISYVLKQMDADAFRIEQILTPEQNKTFQEMIEKRRDGLKKMAAAQK
jgi:protein CpxP